MDRKHLIRHSSGYFWKSRKNVHLLKKESTERYFREHKNSFVTLIWQTRDATHICNQGLRYLIITLKREFYMN